MIFKFILIVLIISILSALPALLYLIGALFIAGIVIETLK
jgi:hypothetical protein